MWKDYVVSRRLTICRAFKPMWVMRTLYQHRRKRIATSYTCSYWMKMNCPYTIKISTTTIKTRTSQKRNNNCERRNCYRGLTLRRKRRSGVCREHTRYATRRCNRDDQSSTHIGRKWGQKWTERNKCVKDAWTTCMIRLYKTQSRHGKSKEWLFGHWASGGWACISFRNLYGGLYREEDVGWLAITYLPAHICVDEKVVDITPKHKWQFMECTLVSTHSYE